MEMSLWKTRQKTKRTTNRCRTQSLQTIFTKDGAEAKKNLDLFYENIRYVHWPLSAYIFY